jgi:Flp pilus assembly protein TadG
MRSVVRRHSQRGAVILTVCMTLLFLLGFMGIALDFGRLFIVKTELQTAVDSCALAAAHMLDGQSDALTRARTAGKAAGNVNGVNFQSSSWNNQGQIADENIIFRDATYAVTTVPAAAKYAQCERAQSAVQAWLLHSMRTAGGDSTVFPSARPVAAYAVASRASAQTACPVPLGLNPAVGGTPPPANFGFTVGQWITLLMAPGTATNGQIGWANLDGSSSASETAAEMNGFCGTTVGSNLGTPGVQAAIVDNWNVRFGLYRGGGPSASPNANNPDFTGYSYTTTNWPAGSNAFDGVSPDPSVPNFVTARANFAACGTTVQNCASVTGLSFAGFSSIAPGGPSATGGHKQYGRDRRLVTVPVVNGSTVIGFACMLMLQPLTVPMTDVKLEFRGDAADFASPCTTGGTPGGVAGPQVPTLVR